MTKDDIIKIARQAGYDDIEERGIYMFENFDVEAFAKRVEERVTEKANARANASWTLMCKKMVEAEREACARLSITIPNPYKDCQISAHGYDMGILEYSRAIRARGSNE